MLDEGIANRITVIGTVITGERIDLDIDTGADEISITDTYMTLIVVLLNGNLLWIHQCFLPLYMLGKQN